MTNKEENTWYQKYWRPSMGWLYLLICGFDFFIAPIGNAIFQSHFYPNAAYIPWSPITLGSGGLFHVSMMAIVGVTAWSRGQEKMKWLEMVTNLNTITTTSKTTVTPEEPK